MANMKKKTSVTDGIIRREFDGERVNLLCEACGEPIEMPDPMFGMDCKNECQKKGLLRLGHHQKKENNMDDTVHVMVTQGDKVIHQGTYQKCHIEQSRKVTPQYKMGEDKPYDMKVERGSAKTIITLGE